MNTNLTSTETLVGMHQMMVDAKRQLPPGIDLEPLLIVRFDDGSCWGGEPTQRRTISELQERYGMGPILAASIGALWHQHGGVVIGVMVQSEVHMKILRPEEVGEYGEVERPYGRLQTEYEQDPFGTVREGLVTYLCEWDDGLVMSSVTQTYTIGDDGHPVFDEPSVIGHQRDTKGGIADAMQLIFETTREVHDND
jgi:hypothetical protein